MSRNKTSIQFGTTTIQCRLRRSSREKTLSIAVDPHQGVLVTAPHDLKRELIHSLILRKAPWIIDRLREMRSVNGNTPDREFVSGESYSYLGRNYRLKVLVRKGAGAKVRVLRGRFEIVVDRRLRGEKRRAAIRQALCEWYKLHAAKRIEERTARLASRLGLKSPEIAIRDQQKRWASCDRHGRLRFNWRIAMAPMSLVDYVVAHELCHLIQRNHAPAFWKLLRTSLPDYETRREKLRLEGPCFRF